MVHHFFRRFMPILLVSILSSLFWFQSRLMQVRHKEGQNNSIRQCHSKEYALKVLRTAVSHAMDQKCRVPKLLLQRSNYHSSSSSSVWIRKANNGGISSSSSHSIRVNQKSTLRHRYNQTTCNLSDLCEQLPQQKQVVQLYGKDPVVLGMETCQTYRNTLQKLHVNATVRVAGLYNSGTNALAAMLQDNLPQLKNSATTVVGEIGSWDVPWGKHVPWKYHKTNVWPRNNTAVPLEQILPVVIVRDPFRWMQSMCRTNYDVTWKLAPNKHCPNLVPTAADAKSPLGQKLGNGKAPTSYKVTVQIEQTGYQKSDKYDSLAHFWTAWNTPYLEMTNDYPILVVRFEDMLFHREHVLNQIAKCVGDGSVFDFETTKYRLASVKEGSNSVDYVSAIIQYGTKRGRYGGMAVEDLRYAAKALNPELMKRLHYLKVPTV